MLYKGLVLRIFSVLFLMWSAFLASAQFTLPIALELDINNIPILQKNKTKIEDYRSWETSPESYS